MPLLVYYQCEVEVARRFGPYQCWKTIEIPKEQR